MKSLILFFFTFWFTLGIEARVFDPNQLSQKSLSSHSKIVLSSFWEELGPPESSPIKIKKKDPPPSKKVIDKRPPKIVKKMVTPIPPKNKVTPPPTPPKKVIPPPAPPKKKLSRGEQFILDQKRKNRERLAKLKQKKKQDEMDYQPSSKTFPKKTKGLREQYLDNLTKLKKRTQKTMTSWKDLVETTRARWQEKQKEFLKNLPHYKKNLFSFESAPPQFQSSAKEMNKPISGRLPRDYKIIPGSLDVPIQDQGRRPTCAAFAGIRALEVILNGFGEYTDLSEQYFYWASKPNCQLRPCPRRGSWVLEGFQKSRKASFPDIPLEANCPYNSKGQPNNETQTPLKMNCRKGKVQVLGFRTLKTLDEVISSIEQNRPVIAGFKLSPNFYKTKGVVSYQGSRKKGSMDSHSKGHALLIIGTVKLPPKLAVKEGKACFVVANSWGEGWGRGGFGCLTEKWVLKHRIENAFISLNEVRKI